MKPYVVCILTVLSVVSPSSAQKGAPQTEKRQVVRNLEGEPFLLRELGAVVATDAGVAKVATVMPPAERPAAYKEVDLKQDDVILMANGRHVATTEALQAIYDSLAAGGEFKLGVKRGQDMRLVSITKGDAKDLPHLQMKIMHGGGEDNAGTFPAVGVVIKVKGKTLVIDELLPGETPVSKLDVKRGDVITAINGTPVASLKAYEDVFDNLETGKDITWSLSREGTRHSVTFVKPQPRMIIRREGRGK